MSEDEEVKQKLRKPLTVLCLLIVAIFSVYVIYYYSKRSSFTATILADTDTTNGVDIISYPASEANFTNTLIYSATLPLAIAGHEEMLGVANTERQQWLNNESRIDPANYVIAVDNDPSALQDTVTQRISAKFHNHPPVEVETAASGFTIFTYLLKKVTLPEIFKKTQLTFAGENVHGISWLPSGDTSTSQVRLSQGPFIATAVISLSHNEELWLVKSARPVSMLKIFEEADSIHRLNVSAAFNGDDELIFPMLDFAISGSSGQLDLNVISKAEQVVKMSISADKGTAAESNPARGKSTWYFDGPYLLCIKQNSGSLPYFMMWVGNGTLLQKVRE
ncbi:MAG: hypothetical protein WD077_14215 [Bacteroidia bacterium]